LNSALKAILVIRNKEESFNLIHSLYSYFEVSLKMNDYDDDEDDEDE